MYSCLLVFVWFIFVVSIGRLLLERTTFILHQMQSFGRHILGLFVLDALKTAVMMKIHATVWNWAESYAKYHTFFNTVYEQWNKGYSVINAWRVMKWASNRTNGRNQLIAWTTTLLHFFLCPKPQKYFSFAVLFHIWWMEMYPISQAH